MSPTLRDALRELAEPFLDRDTIDPSLLQALQGKLSPLPQAGSGGSAREDRARAASLRAHLQQTAMALHEVLEAAVEAEATRLAPLATALDWLVNAPAEESLVRQLALVAQAEPAGQRLGELLGTLGAVELEARALSGEVERSGQPLERTAALAALARVRLARVCALVDRWLEGREERS